MYGTIFSGALLVFVTFYVDVPNVGLFAFHPILMTTGFAVLAFEAVWQFSNTASIFYRKEHTRADKIQRHRILHYVATGCIVVAFIIVFFDKSSRGRPHFASWHSRLGLTTVLLYGTQAATGAFIMLRPPPHYLTFATLKLLHVASGCTALFLSSAALILGMRTNYFEKMMQTSVFDPRPMIYSLLGIVLSLTIYHSLAKHLFPGHLGSSASGRSSVSGSQSQPPKPKFEV